MLINEILNTTGKFKTISEKGDEFITSATIAGREIHFYADRRSGSKEHWEVGFGDPAPNGGISYELSGKGGEFEVFAFVKDSLEEFIYMYNPERIYLLAEKEKGENRSRVYERLLKKFESKDYKLTKSNGGQFDIFTLDKIEHADK